MRFNKGMFDLLGELQTLLRHQWASPDKLSEIRNRSLEKTLSDAYENSLYYRSVFDTAGYTPADVRDANDLKLLPVTSKEDLQKAGSILYSRNVDLSKCVWLRTSGSVGTPFELPFTKRDKDRRVLRELRALMANGYRVTDRMMLVIEPRWVIEHNQWFQKIGLLQRKCLSLYTSPSEQLTLMKRWKPQVLYGYTSGVHVMADEIAGLGESIPPLKLVVTSAELMEPVVRRNLTDAFGIQPTDFYGSMEMGWIAWECPEHRGYHINSDCLVVECIKGGRPAAPGEEGEFVITSLQSKAAPIIRYATGDFGSLSDGKCPCGRRLPLINTIHGRLVDRVVLPSGESISPYMLTCVIEDIPGIRRFQIVQDAIDHLVINVIPSPGSAPDSGEIIREVQKITGTQVRIDVRMVDDIDRERSGKIKAVKSEMGRESTVATGSR